MEILEHPWKDLSLDFVVALSESEGFNTIWVVVDRLTKMQHLVPCTNKVDGGKLGERFIKEVFILHGILQTIVLDGGPQFTLEFWKYVSKIFGVE